MAAPPSKSYEGECRIRRLLPRLYDKELCQRAWSLTSPSMLSVMKSIGYASVSTSGQTLDAQLEQLRPGLRSDLSRDNEFGARADRRAGQGADDPFINTLVVTRLRPTGPLDLRSNGDRAQDRGQGAKLKSLAKPGLDTTRSLYGSSGILGSRRLFERSLIAERRG